MPFEPETETALWRRVYRAVATKSAGTVVTYEALAAVLGGEPYDRQRVWAAVSVANKQLQRRDRLRLVTVRGVGYRLEPTEMAPLPSTVAAAVDQLQDAIAQLVSVLAYRLTDAPHREGEDG